MKIIKPKKSFKQRHKRSKTRLRKRLGAQKNKSSLNPYKEYYVFDDARQGYLDNISFGAFTYGKKTLFHSTLVNAFIFNQGEYGCFRPIKAKSKS
jgi:hypothetical protein